MGSEIAEVMLTQDILKYWFDRGVRDAENERNAMMWPTRNGVFYDITPPASWEYDEEESREIARSYYKGWCSK